MSSSSSSSSHPLLSHVWNPGIDEHRWIIHIRQALDNEDLDQECDIPVSIFTAPKALTQISPESYTPQQVALGPYHHLRPELYEMERYKLSAAKRSQRRLKGLRFHGLVDHLSKFEPRFRACYHKYLNFHGETLSWMMAMDVCFLLEFLQIFAVKEGKGVVSESMLHLVDMKGQKSGHNAVLRDMVMLENQIPLFVLRKGMEFELGSSDEADELLYAMLIRFCKELLPFRMVEELANVHQVMKCAHLLDLLYCLIVPKEQKTDSDIESSQPDEQENIDRGEWISFQNVILSIRTGAVNLIKRVLVSRPVKALMTLPGQILSNLPGMIMVRQIEYLFFSDERGNVEMENQNCACNNNSVNKPPLMEEITIPSVTELYQAGVKFSASNSGIFAIKFNERTATLHLPTVSLDVNTEVTLRNLVAYEACSSSGPLIFTRYTELMNGIIDTAEDAKILREHGIVLSHLKCDGDIADLWNGMSKSIRLTKVAFLDKVIINVNKYYSRRWTVRIREFLERHVFGTWQPAAFLAAVLLLFFTSFQAVYSVIHDMFLEHGSLQHF